MLHPWGTWKNPLVLSNTAKCTASFNRLMISSRVLGIAYRNAQLYGLRSVGSRHICRLPFGFFTMMKEFRPFCVHWCLHHLIWLGCLVTPYCLVHFWTVLLKPIALSLVAFVLAPCIFGKCNMNWITFEICLCLWTSVYILGDLLSILSWEYQEHYLLKADFHLKLHQRWC